MNTNLMFSSKSHEWGTPDDFFNKLDAVFHFTLDPACTEENAKCKRNFYDVVSNGLIQEWNEVTFVNPPYGRKVTGQWVEKAREEFKKYGKTIVMLLPARTDTTWFHKYAKDTYGLCFVKGRLPFKNKVIEMMWERDIDNGVKTREQYEREYPCSAPFPSLLMIFSKSVTSDQVQILNELGIYVEMMKEPTIMKQEVTESKWKEIPDA